MNETDLNQFRELTPSGTFTPRNSSPSKAGLDGDAVQAEPGSMVAYQGGVRFDPKGGGLGRFFKKAFTGEGVDLMVAGGTGDVSLAHNARKIMILDDAMTLVDGDKTPAFEPGVDSDIVPLTGAGRPAGGACNVVPQGTGKVAVTAQGDPDSAKAWGGGARLRVKSDVSFNTFLGRDSGKTSQIAFGGPGWVLIQPSEGPTAPPHTHARQG